MKVGHRQQRTLRVARYRKSPPGWNSIVRLFKNVGDDLRQSLVIHVLAYAAILVAFFLRAYRLADKNVWWDEGWSIWLSQKDLAWIALRTAADEHPPLHYWMLHFWNTLAGTDAFAGRFLSVAFGVLTVALIYRIAKRMGGMWLGILAALFLATARFHVWWSQDIKNYTPSIFFAFAAVWFALTILEKPNLKAILAYALCAALALWAHYLAALVLLALNLYATIVLGRQLLATRQYGHSIEHPYSVATRYWLIAQLLAAALFAPWMILYLQNAAAWGAAPAFDFGLFLKLVATVLPLGVTTNIENYAALTIALTTIAALGLAHVIASDRRERSNSPAIQEIALASRERRGSPRPVNYAGLFALIVLLPPILIYVLSLTPVSFFAPKIQARYLVILVPAYALLLALGIATLRKFSMYLALAATLLVFAASAFVLIDYYAERRLRDEYTTLANTINSFARQGDLVLLDTDQEWPTFVYYLRVPLDWLGVPNGAVMTEADADAIVKRALPRHSAVWLVTIPDALATDPLRLLESRLRREMPGQVEWILDDKRLILYEPKARDLTNVPVENFAAQFTRSVKITNDLRLLGYDLPVREAHAGDTVRLITYWEARALIPVQVNHLTIAPPLGERVRVQTNFVVPPDADGYFALRINSLELARVRVEQRAAATFSAGSISHATDYRLGDSIHLVGYDLPAKKFIAGESVSITLYWRTERPIDKNYTVFVHLLGEEFNLSQSNFLWGQVDHIPGAGALPLPYPTTAWLAGETVGDAYHVPIESRAPAGKYKIEVGMYDVATGARLKLSDGSDSVIVAEIEIVR